MSNRVAKVGTYVYVIDPRGELLPGVLDSIVIRKTSLGEKTKLHVKIGDDVKEYPHTMVFTDLKEAKRHLLRRAKSAIDKMVAKAAGISNVNVVNERGTNDKGKPDQNERQTKE